MEAHNNPFRTTRTDALPFFPVQETAEEIWAHFVMNEYRGAIVGPHGSGKTTLIDALSKIATCRGVRFRIARASRSTRITWTITGAPDAEVQVIDGFDLLSLRERMQLRFSRRRMLVTSHTDPGGIPVIHRSETTPRLLRSLLEQLGMRIPEAECSRILDAHAGNIRNIFREMYDAAARSGLSI